MVYFSRPEIAKRAHFARLLPILGLRFSARQSVFRSDYGRAFCILERKKLEENMAKPITEVVHHGRLEIRRDGLRFGILWIEKGNVLWRTRKGRSKTRTWTEFDDFMTRSGKFKD